jgi:serine/threonine-protein kinase
MEGVVGFLVGLFQSSDPSETLGETVTARQLLDRGAERIGSELSVRPLTRARMLETMGLVYGSLGLIDVAERMQREAFAIREKELGSGHLEVARSLDRLARLAYDRGDYPGAEKLSRQALSIYRNARGEVHTDVARALSDVGSALSSQGDDENAEKIYRETLQMARLLPGMEPTELEVYVRRMAILLEHRGKKAEAEPLYRESVELARTAFGPVHPRVAIALDNLTIYFDGMGDVAQAERLSRESLAMLRKVYGAEHPEVAQTMGNLGDFLAYKKGPSPSGSPADFEEAGALHRGALEINVKRRPDHPYTGDNYASLAHLKHRAGDELEAERLVREVLRIYRLKLTEDNSKIVGAKKELAEILQALGRPAEGAPPSPKNSR